jgi:hypothetical protein
MYAKKTEQGNIMLTAGVFMNKPGPNGLSISQVHLSCQGVTLHWFLDFLTTKKEDTSDELTGSGRVYRAFRTPDAVFLTDTRDSHVNVVGFSSGEIPMVLEELSQIMEAGTASCCDHTQGGTHEGEKMNIIARTLMAIKEVEENFRKIQENPALYGAENGLTSEKLELLEKIIALCGEVNIAGDAIGRRAVRPGHEDYTAAIRPDPNDATAYYNRGSAYYNKGMFDRAIEDFNAALRLNPNDAYAYIGRGNAYYNKKDYRRARADYEKALQINPNHTVARDNLEKLRGMGY